VRIALFDLSPYPIGGDVTWCKTVRYGLECLGHDVTYLRWSYVQNIAGARRYVGPIDIMGYDAVIFSEIAADLRRSGVDLLQLIKQCGRHDVPAILGVHNNVKQHPENRRVGMIECINAASHPWATNMMMLDDPRIQVTTRFTERPYLPFKPRALGHWPAWNEATWQDRHGLLITGRICAPKGQHALAAIASMLDVPVCFAGKAQFRSAHDLLQRVLDDGGKLDGPVPASWSDVWTARTKRGNVVRYTGAYTEPWHVPWDIATAHVNLSSHRHSIGHLEYATIEAIDAGLRAAAPAHAVYDTHYQTVNRLTTRGWHTARDLREATTADLQVVADELTDTAVMKPITHDEAERDLFRHDPVRYAEALLPA